jgi:Ca2+-binding RTX toxin-like protein
LADESPTGTPLVLSANEISGTVTIFAVNLPTGARVTDQGVLEIIGTPDSDRLEIRRIGTQLRVATNFLTPPVQHFPVAGIQSIHAILGAGDDLAGVDRSVTHPLVIEGWSGNDRIRTSGGPSIILGGLDDDLLSADSMAPAVIGGGNGDDILHGGRGRSILIGGNGSDLLLGGHDPDILIGGTTIYDIDLTALASLRTLWNGPGSFATRKLSLETGITSDHGTLRLVAGDTVRDDHAIDLLLGGADQDWLFLFPGDFGF